MAGGAVLIERVLVTGAAGRIGTVLRPALREGYAHVRLLDIVEIPDVEDNEEEVVGDLRDYATVEAAMAGVDAVVHLGGLAGESSFADICEHNIAGTYHVFEAARRHGVERVVYASSNHAIGFYPQGQRIGADVPVRPDTYYGVSKVFGESLARLYFDKFGLQAACLRIGTFKERPANRRELSTWLSHRDGVHLVQRCLEAPDLGYAIVYGVSANRRSWWDNPDGQRLGYRPEDDAEEFAADFAAAAADEAPTDEGVEAYQGGPFAAPQATADQPAGVPRTPAS